MMAKQKMAEKKRLNRLKKDRFVFEAHRLVYHSTQGLRVIKKKKKDRFHECQKRTTRR